MHWTKENYLNKKIKKRIKNIKKYIIYQKMKH